MTVETFATRLGVMSAHWTDGRLAGLRLTPEVKAVAGDPSPFAKRVEAHFQGAKDDFADLGLATEPLSEFAQKVYLAARQISPGNVLTYGQLAEQIGTSGATRAVGTALGKNPFLLVVPCHRVIGANSGKGGFSAPGGLETKARMLAAEGYGVESLWDPREMQTAHEHLLRDPHLGPTVREVGPCPLQPLYPQAPFAALARNVLYQQLATGAARAIETRVKGLGSAPFPTPEEILALPFERLREAGLSGPKISALQALSRAARAGTLKTEELRLLPDQQVVDEVSTVKGLGSWSAEMFLLFHLGRRDLMPVKDLGIRKGFAKVFRREELPTPAQMERWSRPWRPYRSLACWYLWRSLEL